MENEKLCLQQQRKICSVILSGLMDQLTDHLVFMMPKYVQYMQHRFRWLSQRGRVTLPKLVGAVGPLVSKNVSKTLMLVKKAQGAPFGTIPDRFCTGPFFRIRAN